MIQNLREILDIAHQDINQYLKGYDPLVLTTCTAAATYITFKLWSMHKDDIGLTKRVKRSVFHIVKMIPAIKERIEMEKKNVFTDIMKSMNASDNTATFRESLPAEGIAADELIKLSASYEALEGPNYLGGRVSGAVFSKEDDCQEMKVYREVFTHFAWSNPLWPKLFPGVRKMEAEVIRMCCSLMNGDEETCGSMSTGGTISILLACLCHRNRALKRGIMFPEMIVPSSAHAAFTKASEVFRIKFISIPLDKDFKVDLKKMKSAINKNTCMLVGSAPNFPFGTVDDIEAIGKLGLKYDIPVHVDACLGGFLLPFMDNVPSFDFRVPGVTSISADTHKYGLSPKGSSVVLYKNKDYLHNQYFCDADWQGGIYASATMEGSRSGLNIALCWASLLYQGFDKYSANANAVRDATRKLREGLKSIPQLRLQGDSDVCIVSWTSDVIDIHRFHHMMLERNWQLTGLQFPSGVHIMLTLLHTKEGVIDSLIEDCRAVVDEIVKSPNEKLEGAAALYGMAQKIPDRSIVQEFAYAYLDACYAKPILSL